MLDLDHPQTPYIFEAAKIQEDLIDVVLKAKQAGRTRLSAEDLQEANHHIELLETINFVGFENNLRIMGTLNRVKEAFNSAESSFEQLVHVFTVELVEPNNNFGTWAI